MTKYLMMAAVAITLGLGGNALAAPTFTVNGTTASGFANVTGVAPGSTTGGGQANQGSAFYWAGYSSDTGQFGSGSPDPTRSATVGNFLTSTGAWGGGGTVGHPPKPGLGLTSLQAFGTTASSGHTATGMTYGVSSVTSGFTIRVEVAGLAGSNQLWYRQGNILKKIFDGSDSSTSGPKSIVITDEFELYLIRGVSGDTIDLGTNPNALDGKEWARSTGGSNSPGDGQHFASFRDAGDESTIYTGIEDIVPLSGSDKDYNDIVISMSIEEVPAPPALVLAALGIPALGLVRRFTRKTAADAVVA